MKGTAVMDTMEVMPAKPYPPDMTLAELRRLMRTHDIKTQADLARRLKVHKVTVWRWFSAGKSLNAMTSAFIRARLNK